MPTPLYTGVVFQKEDILGKHIKMEQLKMNKEQHALNMESSIQARKDKRAGKIDPNVDTSSYEMSREFRPMFRREVATATEEIGSLYDAYKNGDNEAAQKISDLKNKIRYMGEDLTSLSTDITGTDESFSKDKSIYTTGSDGSINYENNRNSIYSGFSSGEININNYGDYLNKYDISVAGNTKKPEPVDIYKNLRPEKGWMIETEINGVTRTILNESALSSFNEGFKTNLTPTKQVSADGSQVMIFGSDNYKEDYFNGSVLAAQNDGSLLKDNAMNSFISDKFRVEGTSTMYRNQLDPANPNYNPELADEYTDWRVEQEEEAIRRQNKSTLIGKDPSKSDDGKGKLSPSIVLEIINDTEYQPYNDSLNLKGYWGLTGTGSVHLNSDVYDSLDEDSKTYIARELGNEFVSASEKPGGVVKVLNEKSIKVDLIGGAFTEDMKPMGILVLPNGNKVAVPLEQLRSHIHTKDTKSLSRLDLDVNSYNFEENSNSGSTSKYNTKELK